MSFVQDSVKRSGGFQRMLDGVVDFIFAMRDKANRRQFFLYCVAIFAFFVFLVVFCLVCVIGVVLYAF